MLTAVSAFPVNLESIDFKFVNRILAMFLSVLVILALSYLIKRGDNLSQLTAAFSANQPQTERPKPVEDFKPLSFYSDEVKKRDIFHSASRSGVGAAGAYGPKDLIKDFSLAGIYQDDHPEVMIEDKATKKTYFLKQGDEIKGIKVKAILKDRVILLYDGQEFELL